jgi:hypothetical protein
MSWYVSFNKSWFCLPNIASLLVMKTFSWPSCLQLWILYDIAQFTFPWPSTKQIETTFRDVKWIRTNQHSMLTGNSAAWCYEKWWLDDLWRRRKIIGWIWAGKQHEPDDRILLNKSMTQVLSVKHNRKSFKDVFMG